MTEPSEDRRETGNEDQEKRADAPKSKTIRFSDPE